MIYTSRCFAFSASPRVQLVGVKKTRKWLSEWHLRHIVLSGFAPQNSSSQPRTGRVTMSALDALPGQFDGLLEGIGTEYSLEELRYALRKVIYSGAMKLYKDHPEIITGLPAPPPSPPPPPQ